MRKLLAPIVLSIPLALTACGESTSTPEEVFTSEMQQAFAPEEGVEAPEETPEVTEGDTIHFDCYSHVPCDGDFTIETITMSDECTQRVDDYGMGPELHQGETYLQIAGIYELHSATNGWAMLEDPQIINAEGFTESIASPINCHEDGEYQLWSSTLDAGQKAKHFGVWTVPEGATHALLGNVKIVLPEADDKPEILVPDVWGDMPTNTVAGVPRDQAQASTGEEPTHDDSSFESENYYSSPDNPALAEYYAEQERLAQIPIADGGTCPAYECGYGTNDQGQRNPTSGEIQTLDGCQQGYINDPELCAAVEWVETHQY